MHGVKEMEFFVMVACRGFPVQSVFVAVRVTRQYRGAAVQDMRHLSNRDGIVLNTIEKSQT
ncbi:hypothetical protein MHBO_004517 [Bonamia ostreae]|uniref:Uncharacterized protein n=1 Tax=Bonamia ostreae TaxID=126728 RepID=A0ABV2ATJ0_9EUKA